MTKGKLQNALYRLSSIEGKTKRASAYWDLLNELEQKRQASLESAVIKLAYENPALREDLLPLLTKD